MITSLNYNYQTKVEDFVLEVKYILHKLTYVTLIIQMSKSPIVVNDKTKKVSNPREEFYESTNKKILGRKGIILKDSFTNREKIDKSRYEAEKCI